MQPLIMRLVWSSALTTTLAVCLGCLALASLKRPLAMANGSNTSSTTFAWTPPLSFTLKAETPPLSSRTERSNTGSASPTYCEFSWEEKPGYADYTTISHFTTARSRRLFRHQASPDRAQHHTLQGSRMLFNHNMCDNAKILWKCFQRVHEDPSLMGVTVFRDWAHTKRDLDSLRVHMAIALQETRLGMLPDRCIKGRYCNGIGLAQVLTALDNQGQLLNEKDARWQGIAFNVVTNLSYSLRLLAVKIDELGGNPTLTALARYYNGSRRQNEFARAVVRHYNTLGQCHIFATGRNLIVRNEKNSFSNPELISQPPTE